VNGFDEVEEDILDIINTKFYDEVEDHVKSKKQLSVCCEPVNPKYIMHSRKLQGPQETSHLYRVLALQYNTCHAILLHDESMYNSLHNVYQITWMWNPCTKCGQRVVTSGASLLWSAESPI
jgi:hypothetical protein